MRHVKRPSRRVLRQDRQADKLNKSLQPFNKHADYHKAKKKTKSGVIVLSVEEAHGIKNRMGENSH